MILPMKKATIFAMRDDRKAILLALQRSGLMMVIESDGCVRDDALGGAENGEAGAKEALAFVSRYREKARFFSDTPSVGFGELMSNKAQQQKLADSALELQTKMAQLQSDIAAARSAAAALTPWLPLECSPAALRGTHNTCAHTGYIPVSKTAKLAELEQTLPFAYGLLAQSAGSVACWFVTHRDADGEICTTLKDLGFVESAPPSISTAPQKEYERLQQKIDKLRDQYAALQQRAEDIGKKSASIELLCDKLASDVDRFNTPFCETQSTFYIRGWVTAERAGDLDEVIRDATDCFELVLEDPAEGEQPPTVTRNPKLITPFETLTDMFSRPNPLDGIDPNPVMAPWYWLIFGMMMADAGYGLVMLVLFWLFLKLKKPKGEFKKLVTVLMYASVPTAIWGVMFGSYFGAEWFPPILFAPLYNPLPMMIICFALGALHIFCGLCMQMYYKIKQKQYLDALSGDLAWIVLISSLAMLALPATAAIGKIGALASAAVIILFSKREGNIFSRFFGGLLALYNITGFMSDILSYSRILALMLSSAVVGMVMNMLAGMVQGSIVGFIASLFIYIVGHSFNLAMGLLSAYVHASRLQYIEFYGKFYDGGGYAFKPLAVNARYNNVVSDK